MRENEYEKDTKKGTDREKVMKRRKQE